MEEEINTTIFKQCLYTLKQACLLKCKRLGLNQFLQQLTKDQLHQLCDFYKGDHPEKFYHFYDQLFDLNLIKKDAHMTIPARIYI